MDKVKILEQLKSFKTDESKCLFLVEYIKKLEEDFETAIDVIHDQTEKLISEVLRDDLDISKDLERWTTLGRNYEQWVQRFKSSIFVNENVNAEGMKLLKAAKFEIENLRREISRKKRDTVEIQNNMKTIERQIYCYEQIEKLPSTMQKRAKQLCENISSKYKIDQILTRIKKDAKRKI